jgi:hypothetical protein
MARRALGLLLCAVLIGVSTFDAYVEATQKDYSVTLQLETSYVSIDLLDDFGDTGYPARAISWSSREKVTGNFMLGAKVRRVKFVPPPLILFELTSQPRLASQVIFRFQEVYRI